MGKPCVNVDYHGPVWASMGPPRESGFPHKSNKGTKCAHRRNPVSAAFGIAWEAKFFLNLFRGLAACVAMPHRSDHKQCIYFCARVTLPDCNAPRPCFERLPAMSLCRCSGTGELSGNGAFRLAEAAFYGLWRPRTVRARSSEKASIGGGGRSGYPGPDGMPGCQLLVFSHIPADKKN